MIFRALASANPNTRPQKHLDERWVFFEAFNRDDALDRLPGLLALLWCVPADSVDVFNLASEVELQEDPFAEGVSHDQALFVSGWRDRRPAFIAPQYGHPLFLLSSQQEHDRLVSTYFALAQ